MGKNRRQQMAAYPSLLDSVNREKKESFSGQMSLFDLMGEEDRKKMEFQYPEISEYDEDEKLALEKEVLGIYVSGHPLQQYMDSISRQITAKTTDFEPDEDTGRTLAQDNLHYVLGGMVSDVVTKITKTNQNMAFVTLEDLYGSLEILVFPRDYEKYRDLLQVDRRLYIKGRATVSEESGKLIAEFIIPMDQVPKQIWIQTETVADYLEAEGALDDVIRRYPGDAGINIYSRSEKKIKKLPDYKKIAPDDRTLAELCELFGKENVKVVEATIEKLHKTRYHR